MKRLVLLFMTLLMLFPLVGCGKEPEKEKFTAYYFDWFDTATVITGYEETKEEFDSVVGEISKIFDKYHKLYDIYHKYEGVNNMAVINDANAPVNVADEIIDLMVFSEEMYELTEGKFNVAMGSVLSIWHDYRKEGKRLPPMDKLMAAAEHTDMDDVVIDRENGTVFLPDGNMRLDVGAVAKGYACEMAAQYLIENGISGYVINAGGNVRTVGTKPDGSAWTVGIENPDREDGENPYIAYLTLKGQSLVTSGSYQRFYTVDGKNYHHIIDPDTLMPAEKYLSVSVLCNDSGMADALSTALFNMDHEDGVRLVNTLSDVHVLWVLTDGEVKMTDGFAAYMTNVD